MVDRPVVVSKAPYDEKYDIVFSVMQGQQQFTVLEYLKSAGIPVMPVGEDKLFKKVLWDMPRFYFTVLCQERFSESLWWLTTQEMEWLRTSI